MLYGLPIIHLEIKRDVNLVIEMNSSLQIKIAGVVIDTVEALNLYKFFKIDIEAPHHKLFKEYPYEFNNFRNPCSYVVGFKRVENGDDFVLVCNSNFEPYYNPLEVTIMLNKTVIHILIKMLEIHLGDLINGL